MPSHVLPDFLLPSAFQEPCAALSSLATDYPTPPTGEVESSDQPHHHVLATPYAPTSDERLPSSHPPCSPLPSTCASSRRASTPPPVVALDGNDDEQTESCVRTAEQSQSSRPTRREAARRKRTRGQDDDDDDDDDDGPEMHKGARTDTRCSRRARLAYAKASSSTPAAASSSASAPASVPAQRSQRRKRRPARPPIQCCICLDPPREVTSTECGHLFCRDCVLTALSAKPACPICRRKQNASHLVTLELKLSTAWRAQR
ncbi:hypothetical protein THASP1DRAFT_24962 [Thamnocephalis sphaerospora]|uniref:RING-type domain-containing protein n=1 Tax=Thamnocephalis sphaerospora TaxID=78915 RepID=A0A4P9XN92_9FUNG|nr:hypothetical protein THASP1DRAFT_24962 [Thamnocephalis sphaerospora]|eukprot:RKP06780.1 hypothetical protein THASP1DRAFT_24962 [Thamnocephalis sphaerospora]